MPVLPEALLNKLVDCMLLGVSGTWCFITSLEWLHPISLLVLIPLPVESSGFNARQRTSTAYLEAESIMDLFALWMRPILLHWAVRKVSLDLG